jgi:hypothetical protein
MLICATDMMATNTLYIHARYLKTADHKQRIFPDIYCIHNKAFLFFAYKGLVYFYVGRGGGKGEGLEKTLDEYVGCPQFC